MLILRTRGRLSEWMQTSANLLPQDPALVHAVPVEACLRLGLWLAAATLAPRLRQPNPVPQRRPGLLGCNHGRPGYPRALCPYKSRHRARRARRAEHTKPRSFGFRIPTGHVRPRGWRLRGTLLGLFHPSCNPQPRNRWLDPPNRDTRTGDYLALSRRNDCW